MNEDNSAKQFLAAASAALSAPPASAGSTPALHVGDSSFEGWYSTYTKDGWAGLKQVARDSYAAGMDDPLVSAAFAAPALPIDFKQAIRAAEISHTGMTYGDEKSGGASEYTRGWGDCLKAIKDAALADSIGAGWKLVPPVPTATMVSAAADAPEADDAKQDIENMWRAMLAAAPMLQGAAAVAQPVADEWRVGLFKSSAYPGQSVKMVSDGLQAIQADGAHPDFMRWLYSSSALAASPSCEQSALPVAASASDAVLAGVVAMASEAYEHWDADRDMKVGKILLALAGDNPRYDKRADALHAALRAQAAPTSEIPQ